MKNVILEIFIFSLPFCLHLANIIIVKGIGLMCPRSNFVWIVLMLLIVQHSIFVVLKISVVISVSPLKQYPNQSQYYLRGDKLINIKNPISYNRPRGPTDKASDYESGDSRFESWWGRKGRKFLSCIVKKAAHFNSLKNWL